MALSGWLADKPRQRARAWIFKEMRRTVLTGGSTHIQLCSQTKSLSSRFRSADSGQPKKTAILNSKLVGGPGFEPGASRSRTLRTPVQESRKRSISVRFFCGWHVFRPDLRRLFAGLLHQVLHELRFVSPGLRPRLLASRCCRRLRDDRFDRAEHVLNGLTGRGGRPDVPYDSGSSLSYSNHDRLSKRIRYVIRDGEHI
jgi:hypothetical protein